MAELIGLIASLAGIIQITGQVVILAHGYIGAVKRAPEDISSLIDELGSLGKVLSALKDYVETKPKSSALLKLDDLNGPLRGCARKLEELQAKLVPKEGIRKVFDNLKWLLKEAEVKEYVSQFESHKTLFTLALGVDNIILLKAVEAYIQNTASLVLDIWAESADQKAWRDAYGDTQMNPFYYSSAVIDHFLEEATKKNYGVAYMYFEYMERETQTPVNVLTNLLRELVAQIPLLPIEIEKLYNMSDTTGKRPKAEDWYTALVTTFKSFDRVFLVFDALDECDPKGQRKDLLPLFLRMRGSGASVFVTSRQHPEDIQEYFRDVAKIELSPKEWDIEVYIRQRIDTDTRTRRLVRQAKSEERIITDLIDTSQGMFLLAHLNVEYICKQPTAKKFLTALDKIKSSSTTDRPLDPTYNRAIETLREQSEDCTDLGLLVLSWLVKANRTLTVEEVRVAVSVESGRYELDELDLPDRATILDICAGLVAIDETSDTMKLAHYTVQEYLLKNSIILEDSGLRLAMACTTFLTFDIFNEACTSNSSLNSRLKLHPFLRYAANKLKHHLNRCDESLTTDLVLRFLENLGNIASYLQALYCGASIDTNREEIGDDRNPEGFEKYPQNHSPLHIASALNHITVFKLLLEQGADATSGDSDGHTPLHIAAGNGSEEVVRLLLENGVNPTALDGDGETPLHDAAQIGHLGVVHILLKSGVDLSIQQNEGQTTLYQAVVGAHLEVVRLLLENGANCSVPEKNGSTALHVATGTTDTKWSVAEPHNILPVDMELIELLVDNGADISACDNDGQAVIHNAVFGTVPVVKFLLEKGADISVKCGRGRTVLHYAAFGGQLEMVEFLLEKGADISVVDKWGLTLLHSAIITEKLEMVEFLLEKGLDISVADGDGFTALYHAVRTGKLEMVEFLLEKGADISTICNEGGTVLHYAAKHGIVAIFQVIHEKGLEISAKTAIGSTTLHLASKNGNYELIKYLLDCGADITDIDNKGSSALHYAALGGQLNAVQLLIEKGADTNALDNSGHTVLYHAARNSKAVTQYLGLYFLNAYM